MRGWLPQCLGRDGFKYVGPKGEACYVLTHQPKSFDRRARGARPHRWKQVSPTVFAEACEGLDSIISID